MRVSDGKGGLDSAIGALNITVMPLEGDINREGVVNVIDLQIVISNFGKSFP